MTATAGFLILMITGVIGLGRNSGTVVKVAFIISIVLFVALWSAVILLT